MSISIKRFLSKYKHIDSERSQEHGQDMENNSVLWDGRTLLFTSSFFCVVS
jgi:hypothetical protein